MLAAVTHQALLSANLSPSLCGLALTSRTATSEDGEIFGVASPVEVATGNLGSVSQMQTRGEDGPLTVLEGRSNQAVPFGSGEAAQVN